MLIYGALLGLGLTGRVADVSDVCACHAVPTVEVAVLWLASAVRRRQGGSS